MRKSQRFGHAAGVVDVAAGAAGALFRQRRAVVVELKRHADDVIAFARQLGRDDRAVHAARHRDQNARLGRGLCKAERVERQIARHGDTGVEETRANIGKFETFSTPRPRRPKPAVK
jgi:hypothetical protein